MHVGNIIEAIMCKYEDNPDDISIWNGFYLTSEENQTLLDIFFVEENFVTKKASPNDCRIFGIIYVSPESNIVIREDICLSEEMETEAWAILSKHDTEGCAVRGTRKEVYEDMEYPIPIK